MFRGLLRLDILILFWISICLYCVYDQFPTFIFRLDDICHFYEIEIANAKLICSPSGDVPCRHKVCQRFGRSIRLSAFDNSADKQIKPSPSFPTPVLPPPPPQWVAGELDPEFYGPRQREAHDFLSMILTWLTKELEKVCFFFFTVPEACVRKGSGYAELWSEQKPEWPLLACVEEF